MKRRSILYIYVAYLNAIYTNTAEELIWTNLMHRHRDVLVLANYGRREMVDVLYTKCRELGNIGTWGTEKLIRT